MINVLETYGREMSILCTGQYHFTLMTFQMWDSFECFKHYTATAIEKVISAYNLLTAIKHET
jgi:hypothetical protein